ncbi:DNA ligase [Shewanella sp. P1-14-1]|uniref:DNA ligase n=1 Tax=Shewanella sp. P1-14-1 TaxID=1723761 RepID=UPI0006E58795|nr:DNA ligase [Shewanella sp. P1-14-1]KPZ70870.1 DNA ligase [Shewanella sp. P1-14-1]
MFRFILSVLIVFMALLISDAVDANNKPALQLAMRYQTDTDVTQYLISEKLDGVRGYWDGNQMLSRSGRVMILPDWFTADFPKTALDGELWIKQGEFDAVSALARSSHSHHAEWKLVKYMIFDLPEHGGMFVERVKAMQQIALESRYIEAIEQQELVSTAQLMAQLDYVIENNGEGLMLHLKSGYYQIGRSQNIVKLKPKYDAEARVIGFNEGKGKFEGLMGSLKVEMPNGKQFNLGSGFSNELRRNPPPLGAIITYQYLGLTKNGIPRFAHFLRVRESQ